MIEYDLRLKNYIALLKEDFSDVPIIFDVGGHKGESIAKIKDFFHTSEFHSFEPNLKIYKETRLIKRIQWLYPNQLLKNQKWTILNQLSNS